MSRACLTRHNIEDCIGGAMVGYACTFLAIRYYKLDFNPRGGFKIPDPPSRRGNSVH